MGHPPKTKLVYNIQTVSEPCWMVTSANPKKVQGNVRQCGPRPGRPLFKQVRDKSLALRESKLAQLTRTGLGKEGL